MKDRDRPRNWLETMYGLRLPPSAQARSDELGVWVREIEIRASGPTASVVDVGQ